MHNYGRERRRHNFKKMFEWIKENLDIMEEHLEKVENEGNEDILDFIYNELYNINIKASDLCHAEYRSKKKGELTWK